MGWGVFFGLVFLGLCVDRGLIGIANAIGKKGEFKEPPAVRERRPGGEK